MRAQGGLDAVLRDAGGTGFPGREAVEIETTFCNERNSINIRPTGEYNGFHTIRRSLVTDVLHFLLVPDKAAARRVRRAVASRGACAGTVVGTWGELVDQARRVYLLSPLDPDWEARLADAAENVKDAFWSRSYESDPEGTLEVLGRELKRLLSALGPGKQIEPARKTSLSDRGKRHLADLSRLHEKMGCVLPEGLAKIRDILAARERSASSNPLRNFAPSRRIRFRMNFP
jgi:hypothetical protein